MYLVMDYDGIESYYWTNINGPYSRQFLHFIFSTGTLIIDLVIVFLFHIFVIGLHIFSSSL